MRSEAPPPKNDARFTDFGCARTFPEPLVRAGLERVGGHEHLALIHGA
jgi:hypothetical protein